MKEMIADERRGPGRETHNAEMRGLLERRIDALPELYRAVFMLRAVVEMSAEETAAALALPEATVRTRYFRARALLRASLERQVDSTLGQVFSFDGERCDRIVARVLGAFSASPDQAWGPEIA